MIAWLIVVGYVLLGIGTARITMARTVANDVAEFLKDASNPLGRIQDGIDWSWQRYGPLNVAMGIFAFLFWPVVWAWRLVLEPTGTVIAPLLVKWWHAPRDRAIRRKVGTS